jgi:hypothetical protein
VKISDLDAETRKIVFLAHILTAHPSNQLLRRLRLAVEAFDRKHEAERKRNLIRALFDEKLL